MRVRTLIATAIALAAGAFVVATPLPAMAADDHLQVSTDGAAYVEANTLMVYPQTLRFVPGATHTATVWVRNDEATPGRLRIELIDPSSTDGEFARHVSVIAAPEGVRAQPVTIAAGVANGTCTVLDTDRLLAPGQAVKVDIRTEVSTDLVGSQGAQQTINFSVGARLFDATVSSAAQPGAACTMDVSDAGDAAAVSGSGVSSPRAALPNTGGTVPYVAAVIGGAGVLTGLFVFLFARRRRMVEDDSRDDI